MRLFDGTSLNGWSVADGPESAFYVHDEAIVVHPSAGFPAWLRSARQYENFDFRGEFFVQGWTNSGIYLHAPEHGRNIWCGMKINIFHQVDAKPAPESMGSIFPLVPPLKVNVKNQGEWNAFRILMDWPRLRVWTNGEVIQDLDVETVPELRHRLRSGYWGSRRLPARSGSAVCACASCRRRSRGCRCTRRAQDLAKWNIMSGKPTFQALGGVLHSDGDGVFATNETFRDFELQMYVRHVRHHNGGVMFGGPGKGLGRRYEIQLMDVEAAHYATGSLYGIKRALYPRDRTREVVAVPAPREGRHVPRPHQRRHGARVRPAGALGPGANRAAGSRCRPLDRVQAGSRAANLRGSEQEIRSFQFFLLIVNSYLSGWLPSCAINATGQTCLRKRSKRFVVMRWTRASGPGGVLPWDVGRM